MTDALRTVAPLLKTHRKFLLTTHVNPDGDGLGSQVALAEWLIADGKQVSILNHSGTPSMYLWLDPNQRIVTFDENRDAHLISGADVIIVMDTNHPDRLRSMASHVMNSKAVKICIDHHLDPDPFADYYVIDDAATSTGEITYRLLRESGETDLPSLIADALYCAIMTDTGSFRYPRVNPETFRIAAHLIECGANPVKIYHEVYEQWTPGRIKLLGEALASLKTEYDGRLACITVTQETLQRTGTNEVDTDNFTTYPMSIQGAVAGILILELKDGVKISFRSRGDIPINQLAKEFGGNGHLNAAGARLRMMSLTDIQSQVIAAAGKYIQRKN